MKRKKERKTNPPHVVVIGGGIAGLSAGIYLLDNGYKVTILEKNPMCGGECVGWVRNGSFIDGCAHWIVGTSKESQFYKMWLHIGAFDENTKIHETEYFKKIDIDGEIVTWYSKFDKLKEELLRVAPEDKKRINFLDKACRAYCHLLIPCSKPLQMMNVFEKIAFGLTFLPLLAAYNATKAIKVEKFASKFKSPILQKGALRVINNDFNVHSLIYTMSVLGKYDAGMVEGGSLKFSNNIRRRFLEKGGEVRLNSEVDDINIEGKYVKSVHLKNGETVACDYLVSAADAHHTLYDLFKGKIKYPFLEKKFADRKNNPLCQSMLCSFKANVDLSSFPKMMDFQIDPIKIGNKEIKDIVIRNHSFDMTVNKKNTTITVLTDVGDEVYDIMKAMSEEEYAAEKQRIAMHIKNAVIKYWHLNDGDLEWLDLTTPLTYERYCNAYRGSYMSFITTDKQVGLIAKQTTKQLKNFVMSGQWMMPPGGLPTAMLMGKHSAYNICKLDHRKFKELDNLDKKNRGNPSFFGAIHHLFHLKKY